MLFAKILSWLLHPLLMPSFGIILFFRYDYFIPKEARIYIFFIVFFFSFLLPVLNILFLYWRKVITSLHIDDRKERMMPYMSTAIVYIISFFMMKEALPAPSIKYLMLASSAGVVITLVFNYFYKISAHMVGIGGLTGGVLFLSIAMGWNTVYEMMFLVFTAGILATARLSLGAHTPFELWTGFLAGFAPQVMFLWVK